MVGLLSYLRSKGVWGPYLVVLPHPCSLGPWLADLQQLLRDNTCVHFHDGSAASREAVDQLCRRPLQACALQPCGSSGVLYVRINT